ncbi:sorting nexin-25-like [Mya arenaria]|uniref:sorting nexin-25-like n=1 Tax=Mya arenaria TaxID=6604 RepID=UPI0022E5B6A3|nr:sorting nexin-25-like [Mya arenaria]
MNVQLATGFSVAVVAVLFYYDLLFTTFTLCAHIFVALIGIYLGVSWALVQGKQYVPPALPKEHQHSHVRLILQNMIEAKSGQINGPKKVQISRNMDLELQEVIDLVLRDFILSWYKDLSVDQDSLLAYLQSDLWIVIANISARLSKIEKVQFVTQDMVQKLKIHFQDIRLASRKGPTDGTMTTFSLHPWLRSEESELNYLRKVSEALLLVLLPRYYAKSPPIRHLLREVMATTVLKPSIELLCDPDYLNIKLLAYIEYREKLSEDTRRTYTYAATYEDFVKMIRKCEDIEHLKQLRFNIMTEIMQATTIDKLKKTQPTEKEKPGSPKSKSTDKGGLLQKRNLKRYINQLQVAKARCEKQICNLGGLDYKSYFSGTGEGQSKSLPLERVLPLSTILETVQGQDYFMSFLKREDKETLLGFWIAVEKMKTAHKTQLHHLATDIYERYVNNSTSAVKVDRHTAKNMETFMMGDSGPEAFYEAQQDVFKRLESQHYPSFLVSDLYHRYVTSMEEEAAESEGSKGKAELFFEPTEEDEEDLEMFSVQSYHAKQKLQQLDSKISNKAQALDALKTQKADSKISKVLDEMESHIEAMREEKHRLESHILRTEQWCTNTGQWRAHVYGVDMVKEGDKTLPIFTLVIHLAGSSAHHNLQSSSQGWVVHRKLQDFYTAHEKFVQIAGSWLKNKELPKIRVYTTVDEKFLKEAKATLNDYLSAIMKDDRLCNSEALYGLLTPTPEYFKQPGQEKKNEFFLTSFLKSLPTIGQDTKEPYEDLYFASEDRPEDRTKDSIAEPLYGLIKEVYDLQGMFRWFRRTFITFVEVSFGRSINRQLRETVDWMFSEPMIIYYIRNFRESMWPNGKLADPVPTRTDEEKLRTRLKAKEKFMRMQPDAVKSLVGEENARRGTIKMFEVMQDVRLNKHILYELLLLLLKQVIPELAAKSSDADKPYESDSPMVVSSNYGSSPTSEMQELLFKT